MCWRPEYALLLVFSTFVDYYCAIGIYRSQRLRLRRFYLLLSLLSNLGILFFFKYYNFFGSTVSNLSSNFGFSFGFPDLDLLLPVGISFYTFQTLSYTVDVYRRSREPEYHLGRFAVYVSFFPQLVAGPIERSTHFLPQFSRAVSWNNERVMSGVRLMTWGFFKKLVVADRLGLYVDAVYNNQGLHTGLTLWMATVFFAFEIYCDFSGYSDIAIGSARILGFDLMTNFRQPYFSKSLKEFWSRWHISLSTWFRDYVYISLGGNRVKVSRWALNTLIVFLVSGLWHGANWTYVVWGGWHGALLVLAALTFNFRKRLFGRIGEYLHPSLISLAQITFTFLLVCFSWVFFRAESLTDATSIFFKLLNPEFSLFLGSRLHFFYGLLAIGILLSVELYQIYAAKIKYLDFGDNLLVHLVRQVGYASALIAILLLGVFDGGQFIYFQF